MTQALESTGVRLQLDADRCTGHGRCYAVAPELFDADDEDGHGVLRHEGDLPSEHEDLARRAAGNCPERAIAVVE